MRARESYQQEIQLEVSESWAERVLEEIITAFRGGTGDRGDRGEGQSPF